jgi:ABC-type multidrug transport system fused ATPase/permease subunit
MKETLLNKWHELRNAFKTFFTFLKLLRKHRGRIVIITVIMLSTSAFGAFVPLLGKLMVDNVVPDQDWPLFWIVTVGYVAASVVMRTLGLFRGYLSLCMTQQVKASLSTLYFRSLLTLSFPKIKERQAGAQLFRATSDVNSVAGLVTTFFTAMSSNLVSLVVATAIMFKLNWKVTAIFIVFVPVVFLMRLYISVRIRPLQRQLREHNESISAFLGQVFSGVKAVKIFGTETYESLRYLRLLRENIRLNFRIWTTQTVFGAIQWLLESGVGAFLQWWIWLLLMRKYTSLGSAMAISWYFSIIVGPFMSLARSVQDIIAGMVAGERVVETFKGKKEALTGGAKQSLHDTEYVVAFKHVCFGYSEQSEVLTNVSFELRPGHITALVGPSGCGKTTVINLICALYSPSRGRIEINGTPISNIGIASLRRAIALVPQEAFIFEGTVLDNIRYADRNASPDQVYHAARMAGIHERIMSLPQEYGTILKKRKIDLSTGEQQRITIARAFLRDAPIMILDEPFSNIDPETESIIMNNLRCLKRRRTILIISHRLKSIPLVDSMIAIRAGSVVVSGPPKGLFESGGILVEHSGSR